MTLLDSLDIYYGSKKRTLELYHGDLAKIPAADKVDFIAVSALPGDYSPVPGSLIAALNNIGVSVAALSKNPEKNYHPKMPCWISDVIAPITPINFQQIVVFEPANPSTTALEKVKFIFQSIQCYHGSNATSIALPMVNTGSGGVSDTSMLTALFYAAAHWQAQAFPLEVVKIVVYESSRVNPLKALFAVNKKNYLNLRTLKLPGAYSTKYAPEAWNHVNGMTIPSYMTKRQAFAISLYTTNYYPTLNNTLRSKKWTDPTYQLLLPIFEAIDSGLANITPYGKITYRGEANISASRLATYKPGHDITQLGYTSTAYKKASWYNKKYQFDIAGKTGPKIEDYSVYQHEYEVLYPRLSIEHFNTRVPNSNNGLLFGVAEKVIDYCH